MCYEVAHPFFILLSLRADSVVATASEAISSLGNERDDIAALAQVLALPARNDKFLICFFIIDKQIQLSF